MKIKKFLEKALHLEAGTRIEEEQTPKDTVIRRDEMRDLVENNGVNDKQGKSCGNQSSERSSFWGRWGNHRFKRRQQQGPRFNDRRLSPPPGSSRRDRFFGVNEPSRKKDRQIFECRAS